MLLDILIDILLLGIRTANKTVDSSHNSDHTVLVESLLPEQLLVEGNTAVLILSNLGVFHLITDADDIFSFNAVVIKPTGSACVAALLNYSSRNGRFGYGLESGRHLGSTFNR